MNNKDTTEQNSKVNWIALTSALKHN